MWAVDLKDGLPADIWFTLLMLCTGESLKKSPIDLYSNNLPKKTSSSGLHNAFPVQVSYLL